MKPVKMYQVDAFTDRLFGGNPAAVCLTGEWLADDLMQAVAAENNLAETAFVVQDRDGFAIRWFTPAVEVELCGHATLASAYVILNLTDFPGSEISFRSRYSGVLRVKKDGDSFFLDFPADEIRPVAIPDDLTAGIGMSPLEVYRGKTDFMAVLGSEEQVLGIRPDFLTINKLEARGLIVTAPGNTVDFVSRFFGPQCGVNEDPVTGSAHTTLTPYWAGRLGKHELTASQVSARGGLLRCSHCPPRVIIGGEARLYLAGEIFI